MSDFYQYLQATFLNWWALIPSGVFAVDSALEYFFRRYREWLDRYINRELRQRLIFSVALLGVFVAGFFAWRDEHLKHQKLQQTSYAHFEVEVFQFYPGNPFPINQPLAFYIQWSNAGNVPAYNSRKTF